MFKGFNFPVKIYEGETIFGGLLFQQLIREVAKRYERPLKGLETWSCLGLVGKELVGTT